MTIYRWQPHTFTATNIENLVLITLVAAVAVFVAVLFPWL